MSHTEVGDNANPMLIKPLFLWGADLTPPLVTWDTGEFTTFYGPVWRQKTPRLWGMINNHNLASCCSVRRILMIHWSGATACIGKGWEPDMDMKMQTSEYQCNIVFKPQRLIIAFAAHFEKCVLPVKVWRLRSQVLCFNVLCARHGVIHHKHAPLFILPLINTEHTGRHI